MARNERQKERESKSTESSPFRPTLTSKHKPGESRGNVFARLYKDAQDRQERRKSLK